MIANLDLPIGTGPHDTMPQVEFDSFSLPDRHPRAAPTQDWGGPRLEALTVSQPQSVEPKYKRGPGLPLRASVQMTMNPEPLALD